MMVSIHREVPAAPLDPQRGRHEPTKGTKDHWTILLEELVHLLALFLRQSKQHIDAQHNDVLLDQIVRHLAIVDKMKGHDCGILIRHRKCGVDAQNDSLHYQVLFGNMLLKNNARANRMIPQSFRSAERALNKAFEIFCEMGIHAFYLQLPEDSADSLNQLRVALNIVARFDFNARIGDFVTYRYKDATIRAPVIHNGAGRADPNLTLVAALNGLTAANTMELMNQAAAFHSLQSDKAETDESIQLVSPEYNQIFYIRSLRKHVVKPMIEVNNVPWVQKGTEGRFPASDYPCPFSVDLHHAASRMDASVNCVGPPEPVIVGRRVKVDIAEVRETIANALRGHLQGLTDDIAILFDVEKPALEPGTLAAFIAAATRTLYAIDRHCHDPRVVDTVLEGLMFQLEGVPDAVLASMIANRQALKILQTGRCVLIGMVHPRLFDLVSLVKERIDVKHRTAIVKQMAFDFDPRHLNALADGFQLTAQEAVHIVKALKKCFGKNGTFIRAAFEKHLSAFEPQHNAVFEILWCFLKMTPERDDRLDFVNAIQFLMAELPDTKRALQFLLADISQLSDGFSYTDRNAFVLANILLHLENKELYVDIRRTPETVLTDRRALDKRVVQYALWRLDIDHVQFLTKASAIRRLLLSAVGENANREASTVALSFLLSLERELFIFCGLVGGHTARTILRCAIDDFGDANASVYRRKLSTHMLSRLMGHLLLAIRALGRVGHMADKAMLATLLDRSDAFGRLDQHPAFALRVKQTMQTIKRVISRI